MYRHTLALLAVAAALIVPTTANATVNPTFIHQPGHAVASDTGRTRLLAIGDSLTAGVTGYLPLALPGWDTNVDGYGGRPLKTGMDILRRYRIDQPDRTVLFVGLFTNNAPGDFPQLRSAVREALRAVGPNGCLVWNTVYRPAVGGPSWQPAWTPTEQIGRGYGKVNAWLRHTAATTPNMRLVDWSRSLHRSPMAMDSTHVHPATAAGWRRRAQMIADAARSC